MPWRRNGCDPVVVSKTHSWKAVRLRVMRWKDRTIIWSWHGRIREAFMTIHGVLVGNGSAGGHRERFDTW